MTDALRTLMSKATENERPRTTQGPRKRAGTFVFDQIIPQIQRHECAVCLQGGGKRLGTALTNAIRRGTEHVCARRIAKRQALETENSVREMNSASSEYTYVLFSFKAAAMAVAPSQPIATEMH